MGQQLRGRDGGNVITLGLQSWVMVGVIGVASVVTAASRWQVAQAESKLEQCEADKRTMAQAMERQNVRVETWQAAASAAGQASKEAASAAAAEFADRVAPELRRLRAIKATTCADAVQRVREGLK